MAERMLGNDATLWHMECPGSPVHTLKTVVVDTSRLGRALILEDLRAALEPRLGLLPRMTQKVVAAPGFPGRPFWVPDPEFELSHHLDETSASPPGDRNALDAIHSRLAGSALDRERPLWSATLVHGLAGGRQAIVVRMHHAITDGIGAINTLRVLTASSPDAPVAIAPRPVGSPPGPSSLRLRVLREAGGLTVGIPRLVSDGIRSFQRGRAYKREHPDVPGTADARRTFVSRRGIEGRRDCVSCSLDFEAVRAVAKAAGVTVNGVYQALVAAALRDELLAHGEDVSQPTISGFGMAVRSAPGDRVSENHITPANALLHSELENPVQRLMQTARSCREGVELRQAIGLEMLGRCLELTCRAVPQMIRLAADRIPRVGNHVTTAYLSGPGSRRFAGPVEVVDWISFAIALHPSNVNVTAHSYAGRLSIGLIAATGVLPDPRRFLRRMEDELAALHASLVGGRRAPEHDAAARSIGAPGA